MNTDEFLEHYGVKGMQWGVRRANLTDRQAKKEARKNISEIGTRAGELIKASNRSDSPAERRKIADRYKKEVLEEIRSEEFRQQWRDANQITRGTVATHALVYGIFAPMTLAGVRNVRDNGADYELHVARQVLREMRNSE